MCGIVQIPGPASQPKEVRVTIVLARSTQSRARASRSCRGGVARTRDTRVPNHRHVRSSPSPTADPATIVLARSIQRRARASRSSGRGVPCGGAGRAVRPSAVLRGATHPAEHASKHGRRSSCCCWMPPGGTRDPRRHRQRSPGGAHADHPRASSLRGGARPRSGAPRVSLSYSVVTKPWASRVASKRLAISRSFRSST